MTKPFYFANKQRSLWIFRMQNSTTNKGGIKFIIALISTLFAPLYLHNLRCQRMNIENFAITHLQILFIKYFLNASIAFLELTKPI